MDNFKAYFDGKFILHHAFDNKDTAYLLVPELMKYLKCELSEIMCVCNIPVFRSGLYVMNVDDPVDTYSDLDMTNALKYAKLPDEAYIHGANGEKLVMVVSEYAAYSTVVGTNSTDPEVNEFKDWFTNTFITTLAALRSNLSSYAINELNDDPEYIYTILEDLNSYEKAYRESKNN